VAVAAVVVVAAAVVGGAVVVGALVVVGRGAVVGGAVDAGRIVGGAAAAEVGAAVGAGARAGTVVLVVGWRTVLSGVPALSSPAAAVEAGHGRASQLPGGAGLPKAWRARTTTIPAVATAVATHGRLDRTENAESATSGCARSNGAGAAEPALPVASSWRSWSTRSGSGDTM
jgi:hypothetical protein